MNDFLDNLGANQYKKMMERNAAKDKTNYYESESEGKEFKDAFYAPEEYGTWETQRQETFINTCEETYGKKNCHEETYNQNFWSKIVKLYKKVFDKKTNNQEET